MKLVLTTVGVLIALLGAVWVLQGLNILPGSFMTGHIQWAVYGAIAIVVGLGLAIWARRRR